MPTQEAKLSRKQQEIKERIEYWLDLAEVIISEKGYSEFQLVDLASRSGFSTGIVYKQFKTKETITIMLAIRFFKKWHALLKRVLEYEAPGRIRLYALHIGHTFISKTYDSAYRCIYIVSTSQYKSRVSEDLFQEYENCVNFNIESLAEIVEVSISKGELTLPVQFTTARELAINLWSIHYGVASLSFSELASGQESLGTYCKFIRVMFDNMQWKPLSIDMNYEALAEVAVTELWTSEYGERRSGENKRPLFIEEEIKPLVPAVLLEKATSFQMGVEELKKPKQMRP
jgi:AcrR family transcriptional regulator